ncbi:hypothetical protein [Sphingomonas sp. 8AM]|uniref:hypothetical protein n=1 Tax=Sphingomonas sp. 8AM TaxID=2653170 RepID=UPI0012F19700|nr:hypothetical protein [Sphingomonas sp. 8AM]VXC81536.1 conserved membrane hypothetical protein [Sphingomonas sp. 8AM]
MLGGWALAALVLLVAGWSTIVARVLPDADDSMRLLEVRDWLAGQSWFDVAQHRLNGGDFPMHWSRLVDLPLAAVIVLLRPLLGGAVAEHVAVVAVPLLTLLAALALVASIARRLGGDALVIPAMLMAGLAIPLTFQMSPLRIDHHGWQSVLALAATRGLIARARVRSGLLTGLSLATLLTISLEGLPVAAAITGVAALAWIVQPRRGAMLRTAMLTLAGAAILFHALTRGPGFWLPACDAMAPAWLAVLAIAATGVAVAAAVERHGPVTRLSALGVTAAAAAGTLVLLAPACLAGPFGTLPPLVYQVWYLGVLEGRPVWEQQPVWAAATMALPLAGLIGAAIAWHDASGEARARWAMVALLLLATTLTALAVSRAGATANALAAPAAAVWLTQLLTRARAIRKQVPRVAATLATLTLAAPGTLAATALNAVPLHGAATTQLSHRPPCSDNRDMRVLATLPPGVVFAPIDLTPALLLDTPHRAVAGGYHRAAPAIARVITGFSAAPAAARIAIHAAHADYLAVCPGMQEMVAYRDRAPDGLWARLERGERFQWLRPVPVRGPALVWRVIHPLREGRSAR